MEKEFSKLLPGSPYSVRGKKNTYIIRRHSFLRSEMKWTPYGISNENEGWEIILHCAWALNGKVATSHGLSGFTVSALNFHTEPSVLLNLSSRKKSFSLQSYPWMAAWLYCLNTKLSHWAFSSVQPEFTEEKLFSSELPLDDCLAEKEYCKACFPWI